MKDLGVSSNFAPSSNNNNNGGPADDGNSSGGGVPIGPIAGGAIGGLIVIVGIIYFLKNRSAARSADADSEATHSYFDSTKYKNFGEMELDETPDVRLV